MSVAVEPATVIVLHLQPNDVIFINDETIDPSHLRGIFPVPVIPVRVPHGMTVADQLAVIRNET